MPEPRLVMNAKQLAPEIQSEAVRADVELVPDQRFIDLQVPDAAEEVSAP
jgi:hypothetical protein